MKDYKKYAEVSVKQVDEDSDDENPAIEQNVQYGTADPNVPSSTIPCGGCGAHLHCQVPIKFILLCLLFNLQLLS